MQKAKHKRRLIFPETHATIQRAKREGVPIRTLWSTIVASVRRGGMNRVQQAVAIATYHEYFREIYGETEAAILIADAPARTDDPPKTNGQYAELIAPDGSVKYAVPHDGKKFTLAELQGFVGGNIEHVPMKRGYGRGILYVNEDGKRLNLAVNDRATGRTVIDGIDQIVGTACIVRKGTAA